MLPIRRTRSLFHAIQNADADMHCDDKATKNGDRGYKRRVDRPSDSCGDNESNSIVVDQTAARPIEPRRKRRRSYSYNLDTSNFFVNGGFDGFKSLLTGNFSLNVGFKRARRSASFSDETNELMLPITSTIATSDFNDNDGNDRERSLQPALEILDAESKNEEEARTTSTSTATAVFTKSENSRSILVI